MEESHETTGREGCPGGGRNPWGLWGLSDEYGFSDIDGNRPHWGRYFAANFPAPEKQA